jgi:hypothetical protein
MQSLLFAEEAVKAKWKGLRDKLTAGTSVDTFQGTSVSERCDGAWQDVSQYCIYTYLHCGVARITG